MERSLESLLEAATRAPSADNTQPWRFVIDPAAGRVMFYVRERREPSATDPDQVMARLAVGAAIENVLRTARHNGWAAEWEPADPSALGAVRLCGDPGTSRADPVIAARVTNRRAYDGRPVAADVWARLAALTAPADDVRTFWLPDRDRLARLAGLVSQADVLLFGESRLRRAILGQVRFDAPAAAEVREGLSLASLELSAGQRIALRLLSRAPDWFVRNSGGLRLFANYNRRLIASASGCCLIVSGRRSMASDVAVGRAMQRAWLALTEQGLAAQPIMSLIGLEQLLERGGAAQLRARTRVRVAELGAELRGLLPELDGGRPGFLLRFGYAPPPSGRTGRLPVAAVATVRRAPVACPAPPELRTIP